MLSINYIFLSKWREMVRVRRNGFGIFYRNRIDYSVIVEQRLKRIKKKKRAKGRSKRDMKYEHGNADICQEIDNSNKLVAKRSNSLPNGTILPLLPAANRTMYRHRSTTANAWCVCVYVCTSSYAARITTIRYKIHALLWYTIRTTDCTRIL